MPSNAFCHLQGYFSYPEPAGRSFFFFNFQSDSGRDVLSFIALLATSRTRGLRGEELPRRSNHAEVRSIVSPGDQDGRLFSDNSDPKTRRASENLKYIAVKWVTVASESSGHHPHQARGVVRPRRGQRYPKVHACRDATLNGKDRERDATHAEMLRTYF